MKKIIGVVLLFGVFACRSSREEEVSFTRFDQQLFRSLEKGNIGESPKVKVEVDSSFLSLYYHQILALPADTAAKRYFSNPILWKLYSDVEKEFKTMTREERELRRAVFEWKQFFPEWPIPQFYTHVSGWGDHLIITPRWVSVSLDHYLGADYPAYVRYFQKYELPTKDRRFIVRDIFEGLLSAYQFAASGEERSLLAEMIRQGKRIYMMELLLPEVSQAVLFGYTEEQLGWCKANEKDMWATLLKGRQLYETDLLVLRYYLSEGPFTNAFPEQSPARAVYWLGYQIVKNYLERVGGDPVTLLQEPCLASKFLQLAQYNPR